MFANQQGQKLEANHPYYRIHDHFRPNIFWVTPLTTQHGPNEIHCSDPGFAVPCIFSEDSKCLLVAASLQPPQTMAFMKVWIFFLEWQFIPTKDS